MITHRTLGILIITGRWLHTWDNRVYHLLPFGGLVSTPATAHQSKIPITKKIASYTFRAVHQVDLSANVWWEYYCTVQNCYPIVKDCFGEWRNSPFGPKRWQTQIPSMIVSMLPTTANSKARPPITTRAMFHGGSLHSNKEEERKMKCW